VPVMPTGLTRIIPVALRFGIQFFGWYNLWHEFFYVVNWQS
jgi:hypothetical protein